MQVNPNDNDKLEDLEGILGHLAAKQQDLTYSTSWSLSKRSRAGQPDRL